MHDLIFEGASQALRVGHLRSGFQPNDALPLIGSERSIPRYPADTDTTYRNRLAEAWETWLHGGNEVAILEQYTAFGLSAVLVIPAVNSTATPTRTEWHFENPPTKIISGLYTFDDSGISGSPEIIRDAGQNNWATEGITAPTKVWFDTAINGRKYVRVSSINGHRLILDGSVESLTDEGPITTNLDFTNWSRFVVIIEQPHPYQTWSYGDGTIYQDGDTAKTYGSTATVGDIRTIKAIARKWKAGHTINPEIVVVISGAYYGNPATTYGDGAVYGGKTIRWEHQI